MFGLQFEEKQLHDLCLLKIQELLMGAHYKSLFVCLNLVLLFHVCFKISLLWMNLTITKMKWKESICHC